MQVVQKSQKRGHWQLVSSKNLENQPPGGWFSVKTRKKDSLSELYYTSTSTTTATNITTTTTTTTTGFFPEI